MRLASSLVLSLALLLCACQGVHGFKGDATAYSGALSGRQWGPLDVAAAAVGRAPKAPARRWGGVLVTFARGCQEEAVCQIMAATFIPTPQ